MNKPRYFEAGQKVAVLGAGRTGTGAANLLLHSGARVCVYEKSPKPSDVGINGDLGARGAEVRWGIEKPEPEPETVLAVLSPGIPPESKFLEGFFERNIPVISEIELAWSMCAAPVVAITGTNGKTTTTGLMETAFNGCDFPTVACGNIGLAFSDAVIHRPDAECFAVEVSSFQLETCRQFRPNVAVWTNFSPNHLDRYPGVEEYFAAKARVFANQTPNDWAVIPKHGRVPSIPSRRLTFSASDSEADLSLRGELLCFQGRELLRQSDTKLPGAHNAENMLAVLGAGHALGLPVERIASAIREFQPPEHRCEFVAEWRGVRFVNDSKSTNLDALEKALGSCGGPLILIAGGKDKGFGFGPLAKLVGQRVVLAVLIGEMRHKIAADWEGVHCLPVDTLEEAVATAARSAEPGTTVLFSPGTSSFDMFRDYEDRGRSFKAAVLALRQNN